MRLDSVRDALLLVLEDVFHYEAPADVVDKYVVWQEEGSSGTYGDNRRAEISLIGSADYFTTEEYDQTPFQLLDALEMASDEPAVYRFAPDAQELFENWRFDLEHELRGGNMHPAFESHLAKYRKLVPALALVCSLVDGEQEVSITSTARALAWAEYLRSHAERVYAAGIRPTTQPAKALLTKIREGKVSDGFRARDVYFKGWSHLGTPDAVTAAADMLADLGYLFPEQITHGATGGRPKTIYKINPKALRGGA